MYIIEAPDGNGTRAGDYYLTGDAGQRLKHRGLLFEAIALGSAAVPVHHRDALMRLLATGAPVIPAFFAPSFDIATVAVYKNFQSLRRELFLAEEEASIDPARDNIQALGNRFAIGVEGAPASDIIRINRHGHRMVVTDNGVLPLVETQVETYLGDDSAEMAAVRSLRARGVAVSAVAECVEVAWLDGQPEVGNEYLALGIANADGTFTPAGVHRFDRG